MNVGLIAHDSKKKLMQNFCIAYRGILSKHELYATGTTGLLIEEVTNLRIHKFLPGETGGARQLASQIEQGNLDMVIFLRDPLHVKAQGRRSTPSFVCATATTSRSRRISRPPSF